MTQGQKFSLFSVSECKLWKSVFLFGRCGLEAHRPPAGADSLKGLGLTPKEVYKLLHNLYGPQEPEPQAPEEPELKAAEEPKPVRRTVDAEAQAEPIQNTKVGKGGKGNVPGKFPKTQTFVDRRHCYACKKQGHIAKECRKLKEAKGYYSDSVSSVASSSWTVGPPAMPYQGQMAAWMALAASSAGRHIHIHVPAEQPTVHPNMGWPYSF